MDIIPLAPQQDAHMIDDGDAAFLRSYVRGLTRAQRSCLKSHVDGPQPVHVQSGNDFGIRQRLAQRRLLRFDRANHPRQTESTSQGRRVIALILAMEADMLSAAQVR